jgi:hypothetical protein
MGKPRAEVLTNAADQVDAAVNNSLYQKTATRYGIVRKLPETFSMLQHIQII